MSLVIKGQSHFSGFALCPYYNSDSEHVKQSCFAALKFQNSVYNPDSRSSKKISNWE